MVHNGLGISYLNRVYGEQSENLHLAIDNLSKALDIHTHEAFPQDYAVTQFNLGVAHEDAQQLPQAHDAFATAIDTVEFLRSEIVSGVGNEIDKTNLAESWNDLYRRMVEVCLRLGYNDEALEYVERSKTRNLVELIFSRDFNSLFPPDVASQLQQLQRQIASGQSRLQTSTVDNPTALVQRLQQLRQQQKVIQDCYFPIGAGFKLDPFRQTLGENTALAQWYFTSDGFQTFIITRHSTQPIVLSYDAAALQALEKWARAYLRLYSRENSQWWRIQLQTRLRKLAEILQLDNILAKLPQDCDELILVPHQALHLFPLHALPISEKSCLLDCFPKGVRYAPSCQLLQLAQTRQRSDFTRLFAVQNPTGDLAYTDVEIPAIERYFESADTRKRSAATKSAISEGRLNDAHCVHFSCHGYFNFENPLLSSLLLADCYIDPAPLELDSTHHLLLQDGRSIDLSKCFTLADVFTLDLRSCCLVTLSACETGFIDFRSLSDEYIGVPSGFIYAGSPSVVSSLWRVDDMASALLMIRFYQNLQTGSTVAVALNTAQTWLRDTNTAELQAWVRHLGLEQSLTKQIQRYLLIFDADEQLFSNPYYWAAFCAIGQ